jgi:hypothetical protein
MIPYEKYFFTKKDCMYIIRIIKKFDIHNAIKLVILKPWLIVILFNENISNKDFINIFDELSELKKSTDINVKHQTNKEYIITMKLNDMNHNKNALSIVKNVYYVHHIYYNLEHDEWISSYKWYFLNYFDQIISNIIKNLL